MLLALTENKWNENKNASSLELGEKHQHFVDTGCGIKNLVIVLLCVTQSKIASNLCLVTHFFSWVFTLNWFVVFLSLV